MPVALMRNIGDAGVEIFDIGLGETGPGHVRVAIAGLLCGGRRSRFGW